MNTRFASVALCRWFHQVIALLLLFGLCSPGRSADTVTVTPLGHGVYLKQFHYDNLYDSQQSIFVIDANLNVPGVALRFPHLTGGKTAPVRTLAEGTPGAIAAVNAQFFDKHGSAQFLKIGGTLINPTRSANVHDQQAIAVDAQGGVTILLRPKEGWPSLTGIPTLMASGSGLIANGSRVSFDPSDTTYAMRHPRTCVAMTSDNHLFIMVIDGRSPSAAGQTGVEVQTTLLSLGKIVNAVNLDGGGSSTLWVNGSVLNRPSDKKERPVANALVLLASPAQAHAHSLTVDFLSFQGKLKPRATIRVVDASGVPLPGATVTGRFTGRVSQQSLSAVTDSDGVVTLLSPSTLSRGTTGFVIRSISGSNLVYNPAANSLTQATLRAPKG